MNDTTIESILFRAPAPGVPADLLNRLQEGIVLPGAKPEISRLARALTPPRFPPKAEVGVGHQE